MSNEWHVGKWRRLVRALVLQRMGVSSPAADLDAEELAVIAEIERKEREWASND